MDDIVKEFLQESGESLDRLDQEFVRLENEPENSELLGSIFRSIHTIKGTCGFLGFSKLETIAHAGENLLSLLRARELKATAEIADTLLEFADAVRAILLAIQSTENDGELEYPELVQRLKELCKPASASASPAVAAPRVALPAAEPSAPPAAVPDAQAIAPEETPVAAKASPGKTKPAVAVGRLGGALVRRGRVRSDDIIRALQLQEAGDTRRIGEILVQLGLVTEQDIAEALAEKKPTEAGEAAIRVDVTLLEKQMNLVSELVLLRNRLLQIAASANERTLNSAVHGLNFVTSELRKNVMKTRMQPVSQLLDKLPRIVRDVSKDLGKKVRLETAGGNTELDKTLLEAIKDPVTHILRNSLDHGIESPEKRLQCGKPEEGTVRIRAFHEGGNFQLEITDDGGGIDSERVKQKALAKQLITPAQAASMTEGELQNLIFHAGLSTAEKVSKVSGRGVGMDVVKTNVERIGGKTKLESMKGRGTSVRLEIPLTLATIPALTVLAGTSVFAIPQAALVEMMAIDVEDSAKHIETIDGISVLRFRGTVVPLIALREELQLKTASTGDANILKLVVMRTEGRQFAVLVDGIRNTEEIVIKPLDNRFKKTALFSGAAVLGDGRVAIILDIAALARRVGMVTSRDDGADAIDQAKRRERQSLLLVGGNDGEQMAVPLSYVQRLEKLEHAVKERMGSWDVMQYRGEILRLVRLEHLLAERRTVRRTPVAAVASPPTEITSVVVVHCPDHRDTLLEVHRIIGIVKLEVDKLTPASRAGVKGCLVVQERVTELLDMDVLLAGLHTSDSELSELVGAHAEEQPHGR
ncbi:MAG: chemotaxis protein CheW [Candidatus Acidiferrum sp.]|jgi:two-component system chemotaxis sensor kinase CheA